LADSAALFDTEVKNAEGISMASYRLGAAGKEPAVIGAAFALEANTTSTPITGNNGVYMISVGEKTVGEGQLNAAQEISNLNMRTTYTIPYQVVSLIEEKADIIDNRARFQ
jgi:hypothetical protein